MIPFMKNIFLYQIFFSSFLLRGRLISNIFTFGIYEGVVKNIPPETFYIELEKFPGTVFY